MENRHLVKDAIALLAFILLIKNAHSNSVIFETPSYKMAQKIHLSDGRIAKKYLKRCLDEGLCIKSNQVYNTSDKRTVFTFISYKSAIKQLLGINQYQYKHFRIHRTLTRFKDYQYAIERDLAGLNFSQQAYKVNSNFPNKQYIIQEIKNLKKLPVSEQQTRKTKNKLKKLVKKYSEARYKIFESKVKKHRDSVVSGCCHLGKLIGKSSTTGSKRFREWHSDGTIKCIDVYTLRKTDSALHAEMLIDSLCRSKRKEIHLYSKKLGSVVSRQGKKILEFKSKGYTYTNPAISMEKNNKVVSTMQ